MAENTTVGNETGQGDDYDVSTEELTDGSKLQSVELHTESAGTKTKVGAANPLPVSDAGGSLTVDGPLTDAQLRAVAVPVSGTVTASGPLTDTQLRATAVPVSGTVTASGPLTDTQLRATAVPISGTVTATLGALPAGNNNIGDVDVASVVPGTAATNLGKAEDAAHTSGDVGVMALAVRQDSQVDFGADGDYVPLSIDDNGALRVSSTGGASGTEYSEGDTDATITGTAVLWEDTSDTLRAVSAAKPLPIGDAGGSLTVDGTVAVSGVSGTVAVTQSGTWDEIGINDSGNSITVDNPTISVVGSGTEATAQRVTIATDSTGVLSVDDNGGSLTVDGSVTANAGTNLNTSALALETGGNLAGAATSLALLDDAIVADDAAFTPATTKVMMAGFEFDDSSPDSVNEGDGGAARMSANRNVYTTIRDAAGNERGANVSAGGALVVDGSATTQPVSGTVTANLAAGTNNIGDVDVLTVPAPLSTTGGGTEAAALRVTVASNSTGLLPVSLASVPSHAVTNAGTFATQVDGSALTALQKIDDPVLVDDAAFTPATSSVSMAGFQADEASTDSVDEGDAGAARMTLDRKVIVNSQPHSAGGCSIYRSIDLDEGTLEVIKNSPGTVYGMWVTNTATTTRFIKFYDATSGTAGTGTPVITIGIPGNSTDDVAGAFGPAGVGIAFTTGICFGAVTGVADNDTGAPGANDVIANVFYK